MNVLSPKIFESLKPESYLILNGYFHQFSLPMSYVSDIKKSAGNYGNKCFVLIKKYPQKSKLVTF